MSTGGIRRRSVPLAPGAPDASPDLAQKPADALLRVPLCTVAPDTPICDAACGMSTCGSSAVGMPLDRGGVGIHTDCELRTWSLTVSTPPRQSRRL
jgi:hypothetical protein